MNHAALHVLGDDDAVEDLREQLGLVPGEFSEWAAGSRSVFGHVHEQAGFRVTIAESETPRALVDEIREFLTSCEEPPEIRVPPGLMATIDIGFTIGTSIQFTGSVQFEVEDLHAMARLGFRLNVSAYPACDPDEDAPI